MITWADSGFLVALGIRRDPRHVAAKTWLQSNQDILLLAPPVVTETCYFLSPAAKSELLHWIASGSRLRLVDIPAAAHTDIAVIIDKYADRDPDFTDAALVWAADNHRCHRILTVDRTDFEVYRLKNGKRFSLIDW